MTFLEEFLYVNKVVKSCITTKQKEVSHDWAIEWSKRMKKKYPNIVISELNLFLDVIK